MYAAANSPLSKGSSEKYSKFRPHSGLRLIVYARPEYNSDTTRDGLTRDRNTDLMQQLTVPRSPERCAGREARSRRAAVDPQRSARLDLAKAMWSIGHPDRGQAQLGDRL